MSRNLFIIFYIIGILIIGPSVSWAEEDIRYLSADELQQKSQQQAKKEKAARKAEARKKAMATQRKSAQKRAQLAKRKALAAKKSQKTSSKTTPSNKTRSTASVATAPAPKVVVRDTLERLNESIPKKRKEIIKALDVVDHVRTYYTINRGANLKDLQKDSRFKEIYDDMNADTKMMTYLYLKGLYENSPQAITDKSERNVKNLAELPLNRKYTPSKTDIDGFNEKTSFKSKLVRSLSGKYVRTPKPQETITVPVGTSEDTESID